MTTGTAAQFAKAFRELRDAFGVSITFGNETVTAVVQESTLSKELSAGGYERNAEFVARVLLADLSAVPALKSLVTYDGRAYKVSAAAVQPGAEVGEFTLVPAGR